MIHRLIHNAFMSWGYKLVPDRWLSQVAETIEDHCTTECAES